MGLERAGPDQSEIPAGDSPLEKVAVVGCAQNWSESRDVYSVKDGCRACPAQQPFWCYLLKAIAVARVWFVESSSPFTCTDLPFASAEQAPLSKLVVLLTTTNLPPDENVTDGHLPLNAETMVSNSIGVPVVGDGTGVGAGPVGEPSLFVTMAEVEQVAVARAASVAVQSTCVVPTGNCEPDAGEQVVVTGAEPPDTRGSL
jgi:hypothetical protein